MPLFILMLHRRRLPVAVRVPVLDANQVFIPHRRRVRKSERGSLHGAVEGPPHIDDPHAPLEQLVGFVREMVVHARRGRFGGLVDVHPSYWVSVAGGAADGVVEEEDALGAGNVLEEEGFDFGIVVLLDGCIVGEGFFRRRSGRQGGERIRVDVEVGFLTSNVVNGNWKVCVAIVALGLAFRGRFDVVERLGAVLGAFVELELGGEGASRNVGRVVRDLQL